MILLLDSWIFAFLWIFGYLINVEHQSTSGTKIKDPQPLYKRITAYLPIFGNYGDYRKNTRTLKLFIYSSYSEESDEFIMETELVNLS